MASYNGLISQELLKLSYNDRNDINEEIHGVRCLAVEETPELLRSALDAFQSCLDSIPPSRKEVYNEIIRLRQEQAAATRQMHIPQNKTYDQWKAQPGPDGPPFSFVDDENFRLRFLRCDLFDVQKSVSRFINYLNASYEFFGEVALMRVVRISDLSKTTMKNLRKGHLQILPYRDRAGRCVVVHLGRMPQDTALIEKARVLFFLGDSVTRDSIESQQKGFVYVGDVTGKGNDQLQSYSLEKKVAQAIPSRIVAIHSCWPDVFHSRILSALKHLINFVSGARLRFEIGNEVETRYKLRGYGIPIHLLPLTKTGAIKVKYLNEWIRIRKLLEDGSAEKYAADENALARAVVCPGLTDVVFRQGTPSIKNPGNVMFRDTMMNHLEEFYSQHNYLEGHQQQPEQIDTFCNWLIDTTENVKGGKFLEWDKRLNVWVKMIDRQKLKLKVTIAYRDANKRFLNHRQKMIDQAMNRDVNAASPSDTGGGSYAFVEGGKDGSGFCGSPKRDTRSDSNYNETSCWF